MSLVGLVAATLLLVVLPGWLLVNAAFPPQRRKLGWIERGYLAIACGTFLLIVVGVVLGLLPHGKTGFFETFASGMPHVELAMLAVSALLLYVGLVRGAYPRVAARFPRLVSQDGRAPTYGSR
jgi:uncharacterized membrane protein